MHFTHFYEAINSKFPTPVIPPKRKRNEPSKHDSKAVKKQRIVGGIARDPANRQAAIVTSRASWIHQPPMRNAMIAGGESHGGTDSNGQSIPILKVNPNGTVEDAKNGAKLGTLAGMQLHQLEIDRKGYLDASEKFKGEMFALEKQMNDCRLAVMEAQRQLTEACGKALSETRQIRMTTVTEIAQMTPALKDVRQFFIGPDHAAQTVRLKEFVDLCERLQALKSSGFLDAIADTIINLSTATSK